MMRMELHWISMFFISVFILVNGDNDESRLYHNLTDRYNEINPDQGIIPILDSNETISINVKISLLNLLDYDVDSNVLTLSFWETLRWYDSFLTWNPMDYTGIEHIHLPVNRIWIPDITLINSLNPGSDENDENNLLTINDDGEVFYVKTVLKQIYCPQNESGIISCTLKYGSLTYNRSQVMLDFIGDFNDVDVSNFVQQEHFSIIDHNGIKNAKDQVYVTYTLAIKQNPTNCWFFGGQIPCVKLLFFLAMISAIVLLSIVVSVCLCKWHTTQGRKGGSHAKQT